MKAATDKALNTITDAAMDEIIHERMNSGAYMRAEMRKIWK